MQYIIILLLLVIIIGIVYYKVNRKKLQQQIKEDYLNKNRAEFNKQLQNEKQIVEDNLLLQIASTKNELANVKRSLSQEKERLDTTIRAGEETIRQLDKRKTEQLSAITEIVTERKQSIDTDVAAYKEVEMQKARTAVETEANSQQKWADAILAGYWEHLAQTTQEKETELRTVILALDDYKKKQQAVNEAILRQRAIDEQQDFYRVKLTDDAKQDIKYLVSIIDNIKNSTLLYKLIWSEYIQKPFGTMLKNITGGKEIKCVIYKITNINTQEIYIGKTKADVTKRWTEHIKTSLNIGTVARSKIHDALFKHWDEFTFEILEVVDDEAKLSQREKYYINFYQSNIYGYNMNSGG